MTNNNDNNANVGIVEDDDVEAQATEGYATQTTASITRAESTDNANDEGGGSGDDPLMTNEEEKLLPPPKEIHIPASKKLFTDKQIYSMSLWAIRIAVLTDSINNTVRKLLPNLHIIMRFFVVVRDIDTHNFLPPPAHL